MVILPGSPSIWLTLRYSSGLTESGSTTGLPVLGSISLLPVISPGRISRIASYFMSLVTVYEPKFPSSAHGFHWKILLMTGVSCLPRSIICWPSAELATRSSSLAFWSSRYPWSWRACMAPCTS